MKRFLLIISFLALILSCSDKSSGPEPQDLLQRLQALPDVEAVEITPPYGYNRAFELTITQPLDHENPGGQTFEQKFYISHLDESEPMVMHISGYAIGNNYVFEMGRLLDANQIYVGHRFFSGADPIVHDWQYLTIQQAAADHHRIAELLRPIYDGIWVNTGVSKGGMTALFQRRFYPDDVDATVAYVAPLPLSTDDPRFDNFLENEVGDEACRQKLKSFQRMALESKVALFPYLESYAQESGYTFNMDLNLILEYMVLEYPFAFWQYGDGDCSVVPDLGAPVSSIWNHLNYIVSMNYFSEELISYFEPHYYQAYTQFGYYRLITDHLEDLLTEAESYSYRILAPQDAQLVFDASVMPDIVSWLQNNGDHIIYIFGGQDPWTAGAIDLNGTAEALKIVEPGANHGVNIAQLVQRDLVYTTLEDWLEIEITPQAPVLIQPDPSIKELPPFYRK
ncbi:MAG: peptidase [candidate division Zixibacteria bacterium]|nr:peptidase [candidate division Zixibacteria bacterium]NIR65162.1 peptidase [candidate division Zixibacteria bacterium]NIS14712.1 peptidase [candidate division Zixibacteria bacterium]NIS46896.1 peptidase [candidate division Zixibacteria bacterium]NIT51240.1 peptidase [candidate division Zixibacteria bacterium]